MKFQIVGYTLGLLITILGLAEMVPALVDWRAGHENAQVFFLNGVICLFFGGSLILANRDFVTQMTLRQAFLLTTTSWFFISVFAAIPLSMADIDLNYVDAFFEAVSGITTTGATVLTGLDEMSHGILVWRSMMQWIGGLGIVAFAILLLPYLKVGGMQLFQTESSDTSDKVLPRSSEVVGSLFKIYLLLTAMCAATYYALGMSWFEAINHAMTTISTGGYSTHDASFGHFQSASLDYACILFMLAGAIPFVLYIRLVFQGRFRFWHDEQVRALTYMLAGFVAVMSFWLWWTSSYSVAASIQYSFFNIVSLITTTGYATADYSAWGGFAVMFFFLLTYIGACAGSTSGGAKMVRIIVALKVVARQFKTLLYPSGVFVLHYQGRALNNYTVLTVLGFLSLYVVFNALLTIALSFAGLDFLEAITGAATALANVGPGMGQIGPAGNFADLPEAAKWLLCVGMIIGRLEILTVLVLISPTYWMR